MTKMLPLQVKYGKKSKPSFRYDPKTMVQIAIVTPQNQIKSKPVYVKSLSASNPVSNISDCFRPIMDRTYGCAGSTQKFSCFFEKINDSLNCLFTGRKAENYSLFQTSDRSRMNCIEDDNYTFEELQKLKGCVNSNGIVPDTSCNTTSESFCTCGGFTSDLNGTPVFDPHKIWDGTSKTCICDQSSSRPHLSEDQKCCTSQTCASTYVNTHFDCETETCECNAGYIKVDNPDSPLNGSCIRACSPESQNGLINLITNGGYGCKEDENVLKTIGSYLLGGTTDMCCNNDTKQCTLDTSAAKSNAINSSNQIWGMNPLSTTCPRNGSALTIDCNDFQGEVGGYKINNCTLQGVSSAIGFDGIYCKEGSCQQACEDECGAGNCLESSCSPGEAVDYQNGMLKYGKCQFKCNT